MNINQIILKSYQIKLYNSYNCPKNKKLRFQTNMNDYVIRIYKDKIAMY